MSLKLIIEANNPLEVWIPRRSRVVDFSTFSLANSSWINAGSVELIIGIASFDLSVSSRNKKISDLN